MHRLFMFSLILFFCIFYPAIGQAASFQERVNGMAEIKNIRIHTNADKVRVVVDATREVDYETVVLSNPERVVINITGAWLSPAVAHSTDVSSAFANRIRVSQFDKNTVRIVVETSVGKNDYDVFALTGGENPYRVVMDFGRGGSAPLPVVKPLPEPVVTPAPAADPVVPAVEPVYDSPGLAGKTITLDPGHGGSDSGAIGPTGVTEKSITLRVANELRQLLTDAGAKVLLTRSTDVDVAPQPSTDISELQARCDVGNMVKSDIFVSIHMDSFTNASAKGTSSYYYAKGTQAGKRLADLIRQGILEQLGTDDRGTKTCNFYVVKHTTMPATLAEVAFVSNPDEEKLMNSPGGIHKAAQGIFNGIRQYFSGS